MKTVKNVLLIIALTLLIIIFWFISHIISKRKENFEPNKYENWRHTSETNHNVDIPLNTYYSCKNICGPLSTCSKTGEQCTSDIDCFGCKPSKNYIKPIPTILEGFVKGQNAAGKLTSGVVPAYSVLTTDIGTHAKLYNDGQLYPAVPKAQYGVNTWLKSFEAGLEIYKKKQQWQLSPENTNYIPKYLLRDTATGLYKTDDVLEANAYFH
jgi:hypothetical protein